MATFGGIGPINYYEQMVPDFTGEAIKQNQMIAGNMQIANAAMEQARQREAAKAQAAFQGAFKDAYLSDDPQKINALIAQYPGQLETIKNSLGVKDEQHQRSINNMANAISIARKTGSPEAMARVLTDNAPALQSINVDPREAMQLVMQSPEQFDQVLNAVRFATMNQKDQFGVQNDQDKLAETVRRNKAGEALQRRGQDISAATSRRGQDMSARRGATGGGGGGDRMVQLADGRTVSIGGKLHGAGANAFYEGFDNNGNMVRVPANSIASPVSGAANAMNYAMKKDIDAIADSDIGALDFMTGVTGSTGKPALGADVRSRWNGKDQRELYNSSQRIQGRMQNQGIQAARDMGASGINTVAEAKMYFQSMPQVDYSSPEAMQSSLREIRDYTTRYNDQYRVDVGRKENNQPTKSQSAQPAPQAGYSSLWGE